MMRTIIFDFGNVVGFFDHHITLSRLAPHTDMAPPEMFRTVYGGGMEDAFEEGRITVTNFISQSRQLCRLRCDETFMAKAFTDIFKPNPEVCELIPHLRKKYRILLGSNTNELHSQHFIVQFKDVLSHFHDLVLSCRIQVRKPHAKFFEHCVGLAGCSAAECLFIDDMPANIAGAQAAGLKGLIYGPKGDLPERLKSFGISW
jgi:putative hydrolase of the HAD superfamily